MSILSDVLLFFGMACIVYGLYLIWLPLGVIACGVALILSGIAAEFFAARRKK